VQGDENMKNIIEWGIASIIMLAIIGIIYSWNTSREISARIGLIKPDGSYYERVVSIPTHGDIDINIDNKYWIYIDTR